MLRFRRVTAGNSFVILLLLSSVLIIIASRLVSGTTYDDSLLESLQSVPAGGTCQVAPNEQFIICFDSKKVHKLSVNVQTTAWTLTKSYSDINIFCLTISPDSAYIYYSRHNEGVRKLAASNLALVKTYKSTYSSWSHTAMGTNGAVFASYNGWSVYYKFDASTLTVTANTFGGTPPDPLAGMGSYPLKQMLVSSSDTLFLAGVNTGVNPRQFKVVKVRGSDLVVAGSSPTWTDASQSTLSIVLSSDENFLYTAVGVMMYKLRTSDMAAVLSKSVGTAMYPLENFHFATSSIIGVSGKSAAGYLKVMQVRVSDLVLLDASDVYGYSVSMSWRTTTKTIVMSSRSSVTTGTSLPNVRETSSVPSRFSSNQGLTMSNARRGTTTQAEAAAVCTGYGMRLPMPSLAVTVEPAWQLENVANAWLGLKKNGSGWWNFDQSGVVSPRSSPLFSPDGKCYSESFCGGVSSLTLGAGINCAYCNWKTRSSWKSTSCSPDEPIRVICERQLPSVASSSSAARASFTKTATGNTTYLRVAEVPISASYDRYVGNAPNITFYNKALGRFVRYRYPFISKYTDWQLECPSTARPQHAIQMTDRWMLILSYSGSKVYALDVDTGIATEIKSSVTPHRAPSWLEEQQLSIVYAASETYVFTIDYLDEVLLAYTFSEKLLAVTALENPKRFVIVRANSITVVPYSQQAVLRTITLKSPTAVVGNNNNIQIPIRSWGYFHSSLGSGASNNVVFFDLFGGSGGPVPVAWNSGLGSDFCQAACLATGQRQASAASCTVSAVTLATATSMAQVDGADFYSLKSLIVPPTGTAVKAAAVNCGASATATTAQVQKTTGAFTTTNIVTALAMQNLDATHGQVLLATHPITGAALANTLSFTKVTVKPSSSHPDSRVILSATIADSSSPSMCAAAPGDACNTTANCDFAAKLFGFHSTLKVSVSSTQECAIVAAAVVDVTDTTGIGTIVSSTASVGVKLLPPEVNDNVTEDAKIVFPSVSLLANGAFDEGTSWVPVANNQLYEVRIATPTRWSDATNERQPSTIAFAQANGIYTLRRTETGNVGSQKYVYSVLVESADYREQLTVVRCLRPAQGVVVFGDADSSTSIDHGYTAGMIPVLDKPQIVSHSFEPSLGDGGATYTESTGRFLLGVPPCSNVSRVDLLVYFAQDPSTPLRIPFALVPVGADVPTEYPATPQIIFTTTEAPTTATPSTSSSTSTTTTTTTTSTTTTDVPSTTTTTTEPSTTTTTNSTTTTATTTTEPSTTTTTPPTSSSTTTTGQTTPEETTTTATPAAPSTTTTSETTTTTTGTTTTTTPTPTTQAPSTTEAIPEYIASCPTTTTTAAAGGGETAAAKTFSDVGCCHTLACVAELLNTLSPSSSSITSVTIQTSSSMLGAFVLKPQEFLPKGVTADVNAQRTLVSFSSSSLTDISDALRSNAIFSLSAAATAQQSVLLNGTFVQISILPPSGQTSETSFAAIPLRELNLNQGPQAHVPLPLILVNVSRGLRFEEILENVLTHPQELPMQFTIVRENGFPLPSTMRFTCFVNGTCKAVGVIDQMGDLRCVVTATDGFKQNETTVVFFPTTVLLQSSGSALAPVQLRPGRTFSYALPSNLFISSTPINYIAVRRRHGFPLPSTMTFDPPSSLRGSYPAAGIMTLQVVAQDLFDTATRNIVLNFTNTAPSCRSPTTAATTTNNNKYNSQNNSSATSSSYFLVPPIAALRPFDRSVQLSQLCVDPDSDALEYTLSAAQAPSWLRFEFLPGGLSPLPQVLRLTGEAPVYAVGTTTLLNISVSDSFSETFVIVPVFVMVNTPPHLSSHVVGGMPNMTVLAGETASSTIKILDFFTDDQDDAMTVAASIPFGVSAPWLAVSTEQGPPRVSISAAPDEEVEEDATVVINIKVTDALGASSTHAHAVTVTVTYSLWLRMKQYVIYGSAILSVILTIIGSFWMVPYIYNVCMRNSKTIECPLTAATPSYNFPEGIATAECKVRCSKWYSKALCFLPAFVRDEAQLIEMPDGEVPSWLAVEDLSVRLNPPPDKNYVPKTECVTFRCFSRAGFLVVQFDVNYYQATRGWVFEEEKKSDDLEKSLLLLHGAQQQNEADDGFSDVDRHNVTRLNKRFSLSERHIEQQQCAIERHNEDISVMRDQLARLLAGHHHRGRGASVAAAPRARHDIHSAQAGGDDDQEELVEIRRTSPDQRRQQLQQTPAEGEGADPEHRLKQMNEDELDAFFDSYLKTGEGSAYMQML